MMTQVFLATPITPLLDKDGILMESCQASIRAIIGSLRDELGVQVFCAIEREAWGHALMSGVECTSLDLTALKSSEIMLAFTGASFGVHTELGWASALGLPIFACLNEVIGVRTPLVEGLETITQAKLAWYRSEQCLPSPQHWRLELLPRFLSFFDHVLRRRSSSRVRSPLNSSLGKVPA